MARRARSPAKARAPLSIGAFQRLIEAIYGAKDRGRGLEGTFMWFTEEVGELSRALRRAAHRRDLEEEFADVLAWLSTLASIADVDLEAVAAAKYAGGCPRCRSTPCRCAEPSRPVERSGHSVRRSKPA